MNSNINDLVFSVVSTALFIGFLFLAARGRGRREELIRAQYERIRGNGKCEGAAGLPEGATLLLTTDETDGMVKLAQAWLKDNDLYATRTLLDGDTELLAAWYAMPYLRISLSDVEECSADTGVITFGLPSVPCVARVIYAFDNAKLTGQEKFLSALKQRLKCPIGNEADVLRAARK